MLPLATAVADIRQLPRGMVAGNSIVAAADGMLAVAASQATRPIISISAAAARCPGWPFPRTCIATAEPSPWQLYRPDSPNIPDSHRLIAASAVGPFGAKRAAHIPIISLSVLLLLCLRPPCPVSRPRPLAHVRLHAAATCCRQ